MVQLDLDAAMLYAGRALHASDDAAATILTDKCLHSLRSMVEREKLLITGDSSFAGVLASSYHVVRPSVCLVCGCGA
jgi:hypothetical protein